MPRRCSARIAFLVAILWTAGSVAAATRVLFVGNSFFYGAVSSVEHYRPTSVQDLNGTGYGGVPALFKRLTEEVGMDAEVALEAVPGVGFDEHYQHRLDRLVGVWDTVVMSSYSTLDREHPGDPTALLHDTPLLAHFFLVANPAVHIYLNATWTRADQTYLPTGHWYGKSVAAMAEDVYAGYAQAQAAAPLIRDVIPTGSAWTRAIHAGIADANPYDGIDPGTIDLWASDHYHASNAGYYLEALVIFGAVTGHDPLRLGAHELVAADLGIESAVALALQQVAHDELIARHAATP